MFGPIEERNIQNAVRTLFVGSAVLFLATIVLGIINVFVSGDIPHAQLLAHLHSGTIGWVTLSVIATTLWAFHGGMASMARQADVVWLITGIGLVAVAGYIAAFGLAFSDNGPMWMLPLFGIPSGLVIISACIYAGMGLRRVPVVTTPHVMLFGALLVASLGAVMGILVGLSHAGIVHAFPDREGADVIGAHAGPMDMYLALAFAGISEALLVPAARRSKAAIAQVSLGTASGFLAGAALYVGIGPLVPLALLLFLVAFLVYFIRVGWRAVVTKPARGRDVAIFFGGLGFPVYIGLFVFAVIKYFSQGLEPPAVLGVVFVHVTFVAMATNWLFATHSAFAGHERLMTKAEPIGAWITNVGLLVFIAGEAAMGVRDGALLMALGILVSWYVIVKRMWQPDEGRPVVAMQAD